MSLKFDSHLKKKINMPGKACMKKEDEKNESQDKMGSAGNCFDCLETDHSGNAEGRKCLSVCDCRKKSGKNSTFSERI